MKKDTVIRYVVTHIGSDGMRVLTLPAQGRYTFPTRAEALNRLQALVAPPNDSAIFGPQAVGTFEVRACECWPVHFDPKGIYFPAGPEATIK